MEPFRWRVWARMVSIVDTLMTSIQLLQTLWVIYSNAARLAGQIGEGGFDLSSRWKWLVIMWSLLAFNGISLTCQLWVAVKLWKGTSLALAGDISEVWRRARLWCRVNIPFMFLTGILLRSPVFWLGSLIWRFTALGILILIKAIFLLVVGAFIKELEFLETCRRERLADLAISEADLDGAAATPVALGEV